MKGWIMTLGQIFAQIEQIEADITGVDIDRMKRLHPEQYPSSHVPEGYLSMDATFTWFDTPKWNDPYLEVGEIYAPERKYRLGIIDSPYIHIFKERMKVE